MNFSKGVSIAFAANILFLLSVNFASNCSTCSFNDSKYDEETVERLQRNMFYVAMTRAMDMLTVITWNNSNNTVINDIKKCILEQ